MRSSFHTRNGLWDYHAGKIHLFGTYKNIDNTYTNIKTVFTYDISGNTWTSGEWPDTIEFGKSAFASYAPLDAV